MNLAHLTLYSERLPRSVLESLRDGGDGVGGSWWKEPSPFEAAAVELAAAPLAEIMQRLRKAYGKEAELARRFPHDAATRAWGAAGYGPRLWSPARIVAKSFQHTWEHGNSILRVALFAPRDLTED